MKPVLFFLIMTTFTTMKAQMYSKKNPFAHTYSIVARDTVTGEMGVAVQSHWFAVGSLVAWGRAGVGVVATQSFINPSFGPRGLDLLEIGLTPEMAVKSLLDLDEGRELRQLAILDVKGRAFGFTGANCIQYAGNLVGDNFAVQSNLMEKPTVNQSMATAFENTKGALADRLMAALFAAQKEGGDIRGQQAAAILVVKAESTGNEWEDKVVDLRVDDSPHPLDDLQHLLEVHKAYDFMNQGDLAIEHGDFALAVQNYKQAQSMFPDNQEMKFWYAVTLANNGDFKEAKSVFAKIFKKEKNWQELVPRLVKSKLLLITKSQEEELKML